MRLRGDMEGVQLTQKEKQILEKLSQGFTSQKIAEEFFMAVSTINNYRNTLIEKFEAKNVTDMVRIALEKGYI